MVAEGSAGVLLLLVLAKGVAYALSLGAGFRGGPVFPAIALGAALGVAAAEVLPGLATTPALAAGIAAGTAAVMRVPFAAVLLATLLLGSVGRGRRADRRARGGRRLARRDLAPDPGGSCVAGRAKGRAERYSS